MGVRSPLAPGKTTLIELSLNNAREHTYTHACVCTPTQTRISCPPEGRNAPQVGCRGVGRVIFCTGLTAVTGASAGPGGPRRAPAGRAGSRAVAGVRPAGARTGLPSLGRPGVRPLRRVGSEWLRAPTALGWAAGFSARPSRVPGSAFLVTATCGQLSPKTVTGRSQKSVLCNSCSHST